MAKPKNRAAAVKQLARRTPQPSAAPRARSSSTGDTVTVACKMPSGIFIQAEQETSDFEPMFGGGTRPIKKFMPVGERVRINGNAINYESLAHGILPGYEITGMGSGQVANQGYALTHGVPRDIWENWLEHHKDDDIVKNGLVFAQNSAASARDQAKDGHKIRSGFEPIDPENPGRGRPGLSRIRRGTVENAVGEEAVT